MCLREATLKFHAFSAKLKNIVGRMQDDVFTGIFVFRWPFMICVPCDYKEMF